MKLHFTENISIAVLMLLIGISCTNNNTPVQRENKQATNEKILNGIELQTKDVVVSQAYLIDSNDGTLISPTNVVAVNQPVTLRLLIVKGWKERNGLVSIGASETITTHDGQVLLKEKDFFKNKKQLDANDAHVITLTAAITVAKKAIDYFVVSFIVWDKNGPGEIRGHYRLYVK